MKINCTHASIFRSALLHKVNSSSLVRKRIVGLLANTAALDPEELDNSADLVQEEPETFGKSVAGLHGELGMKILGAVAEPTSGISVISQRSLPRAERTK